MNIYREVFNCKDSSRAKTYNYLEYLKLTGMDKLHGYYKITRKEDGLVNFYALEPFCD